MSKKPHNPKVIDLGASPIQAAPTAPAPQLHPWLATREENIRLSALSLAVQTTGSSNKVKLAREYLGFLMPERDLVD